VFLILSKTVLKSSSHIVAFRLPALLAIILFASIDRVFHSFILISVLRRPAYLTLLVHSSSFNSSMSGLGEEFVFYS
jgi:hypothetical protein